MNAIPVYLVVGFLGAGKTTLLKRLVQATADRRFLFVVNEFSAVDVDAAQIERAGGAAVAVAGGSIFCRCLITEFIAVMKKIAAGVSVGGTAGRPEGVVIEASGMADPRSMSRLLAESALDRDYRVAGVTAVVDPGVLMKLLLVLPNIRGQIQCADLILFNKTDLHSPEMVDQVTERVRTINPRAGVLHCVHCDVDPAVILTADTAVASFPADAEYNQCRDPRFERDALVFGAPPAIDEIRALFAGESGGLYRAKGFVECAQGWFFVDWSGGRLSCQPASPQPVSSLTLIWDPQNEPPLVGRLRFLAL